MSVAALLVVWLRALNHNNFTGSIPDSISTLTSLKAITLNNNQLTGSIPSAIFSMTKLTYHWLDNNNIEGPLPSSLCSLPWLWRVDVSGNSMYGRMNRNFKNMVADGDARINLARNFFFGDVVLFAAGCQVCPTEISDPNNLDMGDTFDVLAGKCNNLATTSRHYFSVAGAGKEARVSLLGNCLTLSPDGECSSNATQRSTAACQAFCSITENGPCFTLLAAVVAWLLWPCGQSEPPNLFSFRLSHCCTYFPSAIYASLPFPHALSNHIHPWWITHPVCLCVCTEKWEGLDVCEQFSLEKMMKATNNWSKDNVLGKGGFGIVYKGYSPQGQLWAIKRSKIMTNDFETEVVRI
ncbi:unnamed protein product, partial [Closterium sp. NIES-54]